MAAAEAGEMMEEREEARVGGVERAEERRERAEERAEEEAARARGGRKVRGTTPGNSMWSKEEMLQTGRGGRKEEEGRRGGAHLWRRSWVAWSENDSSTFEKGATWTWRSVMASITMLAKTNPVIDIVPLSRHLDSNEWSDQRLTQRGGAVTAV